MTNLRWTPEQLRKAGIDRRKLNTLLRLFDEAEPLLKELKLHVYGNDGMGNLIHESRPEHIGYDNMKPDYGAVVACVGFGYDGGGW